MFSLQASTDSLCQGGMISKIVKHKSKSKFEKLHARNEDAEESDFDLRFKHSQNCSVQYYDTVGDMGSTLRSEDSFT